MRRDIDETLILGFYGTIVYLDNPLVETWRDELDFQMDRI